MKKRGLLICVEGIDASGKTTQAKKLVLNLGKEDYVSVYTSEPSNGVIGKFIKKNILYAAKRDSNIIEALLFAADRVDHLKREIEPALKEGKIVVTDRYIFSSIAYQGATGLDRGWIESINKWALPPDLAVYLDVPAEIAVDRMLGRRSVMETLLNQKKVRQNYLKLVEERRLKLVNGSQNVDEIEKKILAFVKELLKSKKLNV